MGWISSAGRTQRSNVTCRHRMELGIGVERLNPPKGQNATRYTLVSSAEPLMVGMSNEESFPDSQTTGSV